MWSVSRRSSALIVGGRPEGTPRIFHIKRDATAVLRFPLTPRFHCGIFAPLLGSAARERHARS